MLRAAHSAPSTFVAELKRSAEINPMTRLDFFIDGKAIGCFLDEVYPARPGRYRYSPYRGEGHALMVAALQKGTAATCRFTCDGH